MIYIQNIVNKMRGGKEDVLPDDARVRFDFDGKSYEVWYDEGLQICKTEIGRTINEGTIKILPICSNRIDIQ